MGKVQDFLRREFESKNYKGWNDKHLRMFVKYNYLRVVADSLALVNTTDHEDKITILLEQIRIIKRGLLETNLKVFLEIDSVNKLFRQDVALLEEWLPILIKKFPEQSYRWWPDSFANYKDFENYRNEVEKTLNSNILG